MVAECMYPLFSDFFKAADTAGTGKTGPYTGVLSESLFSLCSDVIKFRIIPDPQGL
jgi:hypothetical protein